MAKPVIVMKSDIGSAFIVKGWAALLILTPAILMLKDAAGRLDAVTFLFFLAAFFFASLAIVEVHDGKLRYRRFLRWIEVPREQVVSGGTVWPPLVGYIRLNSYALPWGRIYFVLDENINPKPFHRGEYAILQYLNGAPYHMRGDAPSRVAQPQPRYERRWQPYLRLAAGFVGGLLAHLTQIYLSLPVASRPGSPPTRMVDSFWRMIESRPSATAIVLVCICLAVSGRRGSGGWAYAFVAGAMIALSYLFPPWLWS